MNSVTPFGFIFPPPNIQNYKLKCSEFKDSLNDNDAPAHEIVQLQHSEPEVKEVYGTLLDDLNVKYNRLLSLFQQLLATLPDDDADKEVSQSYFTYLNNDHGRQCEIIALNWINVQITLLN